MSTEENQLSANTGMNNQAAVPAAPADPSKSNISNPFFTHHSDHPGLILVSKPLNGDNYSTWKRAMTLALNSKNKLGFVNNSIKIPSEETDPEGYATWSRCNDMVHSWLINALSPDISNSVIYYSTAHEVWEDLNERFSQSNAPRIFEIQREIAYFKQEQLSVSSYYTRLKGLWDELASYDNTAHGAQQDQQKLMQFLMGLNDSYSAIRGQILLMNPLPSIRQAYSSISQEEKQRILTSSHATIEPINSAAMAVRGRPNQARHGRFNRSYGSHEPRSQERQPESFKDDRRRQGTFAGRGRPNCSHCGENGHWVHTCYELNGYPMGHPRGRFQPGSGSGSGSRNFGRGNRPAGSHMAESSWARPAVNHVAESSWARPPANSTAETNPKVDGSQFMGISEDQLKQLLSLVSKNDDSISQANAVTKPGSGYEEDDWFG